MSDVTNVLLSFSCMEQRGTAEAEDDAAETYRLMYAIQAWLVARGYGAFGADIDCVAGGTKHLETNVFCAGFNSFAVEPFLTFLRSLPWEDPQNVQLFVQAQDAERFTLLNVCAAPG